MKIEDHIFKKYLHQMVIDQLKEEYREKGWKIILDTKVGQYSVDLIIRKDKRTIVFEIKTGKYTEKERKKIERMRGAALEKGYEFRLVIANPPKERSIEVIGLDHLFYEHFIDNVPDELESLSSATIINDIYDIEISRLVINEGKNIEVDGVGIISVSLQYGGSSDSTSLGDSFPFSFTANLVVDDGKMRIEEVSELEVDTSSFYE